jgi:hypothetical protein
MSIRDGDRRTEDVQARGDELRQQTPDETNAVAKTIQPNSVAKTDFMGGLVF